MNVIAKSYWRSVQRGTRKLEEVPEKLRPDVKALAMQDVSAGKLSQELYEELVGEPYEAMEG